MGRDTDLLPWILGGCLACAAAVVTAGALGAPENPSGAPSGSTATSQAPSPAAPAASPSPASGSAPAAASLPQGSSSPSAQTTRAATSLPSASSGNSGALDPVVMSSKARPQLPPGQVWECEINGQRVFSDSQCGAHATVRQLGDLNVMDHSTAPRPDVYGYGYGAPYPPAGNAPLGYYPPPADQTDYSGDPYVGESYIVIHDRYRREHHPHPTTPPPAAPRPAAHPHPAARN
jgi:predicted outer membrane lipoprotein